MPTPEVTFSILKRTSTVRELVAVMVEPEMVTRADAKRFGIPIARIEIPPLHERVGREEFLERAARRALMCSAEALVERMARTGESLVEAKENLKREQRERRDPAVGVIR